MSKKSIVQPTDYCTDPRSNRFFAGATFEKKASVLKHLSPEKFASFEAILTAVLRDAFRMIGPNPADVKSGGY